MEKTPKNHASASDTSNRATDWRGRLAVVLATGGGVGLFPFAPGTFGSILGLPVAWGVTRLPAAWMQLATIIALASVGVPICTLAARRMGGLKDPGSIVFDEIVGVAVTFFLIDLDGNWPGMFVAGFLLFRFFDITKPPPARRLEYLPDGWGVMADDVMAGIYANVTLHVLLSGWL